MRPAPGRCNEESRYAAISSCTPSGVQIVATAKPNERAVDQRKRVICVYSYDGADDTDRLRIREELRNLGFHSKLRYKLDQATFAGVYSVNGDRQISAFIDP
ncbi:MAG: hypothetical protein DCC46_11015 [Armatimonadetes bacterium]|nr:MAG: hypothetical protein DCC46_11015 [Armatimonadota bacterium]